MTFEGSTLPARTRTAGAGEGTGTTRRGLLGWATALGGGALLTACGTDDAPVVPGAAQQRPEEITDPDEALELLRQGNARFAAARAQHPDSTPARRRQVARGQHPFAIVLSCADSRVPPELVFDQGLGDLFVVRTAGQVLAPPVLGSIQYGVEHLHAPLLVVLGHERCGAVSATLEAVEKGSGPSGTAIDSLVDAIRPAAERALAGTDEAHRLAEAVRLNVGDGVAALAADPLLAGAVEAGHLRITGATYGLDDGAVAFL
ncbi:carbonic anhydrase [Kineococcus glutinatus]|uniref:carbonic anhydrase n=1 Tax=Kineococcus glutinatus TaxID=1070872 RepID=A0ABP9HQ31_9ACTN